MRWAWTLAGSQLSFGGSEIREADQFDPLVAQGTAHDGIAQRVQFDLTLSAIHRDKLVRTARMTRHFGHAGRQIAHSMSARCAGVMPAASGSPVRVCP